MGVRHNLILTGLSLSKLYIKIRHIPHFFVVPEKKFRKPIKAFTKLFWGTTKNCGNKKLH